MRTKTRRKPSAAQKAAAKMKRLEIIERSKVIQLARKAGISPYADFSTVNEGLMHDLKAETGIEDWRTFKQWKDEGFSVRKGEKASTIWGAPRKTKVDQQPEAEQSETEKSFSFFPLCYLFHAGQVEDKDGNDGTKAKPYKHETEHGHIVEYFQGEPAGIPENVFPLSDPIKSEAKADAKHIEKLRSLADGMTSTIEAKLAPSNQNPTPKRLQQESHRRCDGEQMKQAQALLYRIANDLEAGRKIPEWVNATSKKAAMETVKAETELTRGTGYYDPAYVSFSERLKEYTSAEHERDIIAEKVRAMSLANIPGYFTTPEEIGKMVIERANIQEGDYVLEPSAGHGALADLSPVKPVCCEKTHSLREILILKGYDVPVDDFMTFGNAEAFDKIIMNPPFEKGQDVDHVTKAWGLLAPGGRLVAVMSASVKYNSQSKFAAFRELVEENGCIEDLPEGSFKKSGTGVNTVLVTLDNRD